MSPHDLIIVGGGPAGLCAAINAASEGLSTLILDGASELGGQAHHSSNIENFPGFPNGVSGSEFTKRCIEQVVKFGAEIHCPQRAVALLCDPGSSPFFVETDDGNTYSSRAVILASGLQYRLLNADRIGSFMGRGVFYGPPPAGSLRAPGHSRIRNVVVVGGANSAGQAAVHLASLPNTSVALVSRSPLEKGMSDYLVRRIRASDRIVVREGSEIVACEGGSHLAFVHVTVPDEAGGGHVVLPCQNLVIFIGAIPRTYWLKGCVRLDERGFVDTRGGFETSRPGVFACGDLRAGSIKRVTGAVGEGVSALQGVYKRWELGPEAVVPSACVVEEDRAVRDDGEIPAGGK